MPRATAFRLPLCELIDADFFRSEEGFKPAYVITKSGLKASRVLAWGCIAKINRSSEEEDSSFSDKKFKSIVLDDFTACLSAVAFEEKMALLEGLKEGDVVSVIGKIRQGRNRNYLLVEQVKKIIPNQELLRRVENVLSLVKLKKEEAPPAEDEVLAEEKLEIEKNVLM